MGSGTWRAKFPVGTRVVLMPPHPWADNTGEVDRHETMFFTDKPSLVVNLDNGFRAGVTNPDHLELEEKGARRG